VGYVLEVDLAVTAGTAGVSREGKLNVLGVFDTVRARQFPFRRVAMVIVVPDGGLHRAGGQRMGVRLPDADAGRVFKAEGPVQDPGVAMPKSRSLCRPSVGMRPTDSAVAGP
jgi:hypothetical protein